MKFSLVILLLTFVGSSAQDPVVQLGKLRIHGLQVADTSGAHSNAYLGIPFAQPPVGELRWANPRPLAPPTQPQNFFAKTIPKQCPQIMPSMGIEGGLLEVMMNAGNDYNNASFADWANATSEDCLYLNVFTPNNGNTRRPVMVWIHGGAFVGGSGLGYDGRVLAISQDVVVVVIQYRLGVFGFLSTADSAAQGNWGLKDQTMALRWVQANIGAFGGDPYQVTIFGESAGAVSCGMHSISPYSAGLFQNSILHSGTEYMAIYTHNPLQMSRSLGQEAGCDTTTNSSSGLITCLRGKSQVEIFNALQKMQKKANETANASSISESEALSLIAFFPTIDGEFFPESPMLTKYVNPGNMVVGFNSDEFGFLMADMFQLSSPLSEQQFSTKLEDVAQSLAQGNAEYVPKFLEKLKLIYNASQDPLINKKTAQRAMADSMFVANAFMKADKYSKSGNKVYMYELLRGMTLFQDHSLLNARLVNVSKLTLKPADVGGDHADDIAYTFGFPFNPNFEAKGYNSTDGDRMISGLMMKFWGEFARSGTIHGWPEYTPSRRTVLQLDRREPYIHIAHDPRAEFLNLWTVQIPALLDEMNASLNHTNGKPIISKPLQAPTRQFPATTAKGKVKRTQP